MSKVTVEEARGAAALSALRTEWQALYSVTQAPPFLSWEWADAWQNRLGQGLTPRVLCARQGGALVGLLPLGEEARTLTGLGRSVRRLCFLGERFSGADYLDVLALPGSEQEVTAAIFEHLGQQTDFDLLELEGVAADSLSLSMLVRRFGDHAGFTYQLASRDICP